jgi:hypothetical protein
MANAITTTDVQKAALELGRMRRSLRSWLKVRALNDRVLAGTVAQIRTPLPYAQRVIAARRDMAAEQDLATKLAALLGEILPDALLPNADLTANPNGAVQLAQIAITGQVPVQAASPQASAGFTHPWLWPALIVGAVLLTITTAIKTAADVAKDQEEKACIEAGACTDYGFWLKAGGVLALAWFAWRELGVGDEVKKYVGRRRT